MKKIIIGITVFIIFSISFLLYFKLKSIYRWQQFLFSIKNTQNVDVKKYWLFRQKFSPGTISINNQVIDLQETFHLNKITDPLTPLSSYKSSHLIAKDSLVTEAYLSTQITTPSGEVVWQHSYNSLVKNISNQYVLTYAFTIDQMRQVYGLLNFTGDELKLLSNHYWLTQAIITL